MREYIKRLERRGEIIAVALRPLPGGPSRRGGRRSRLLGMLVLGLPVLIAASTVAGERPTMDAATETACALKRSDTPTHEATRTRSHDTGSMAHLLHRLRAAWI